jgi:hypothetical protein
MLKVDNPDTTATTQPQNDHPSKVVMEVVMQTHLQSAAQSQKSKKPRDYLGFHLLQPGAGEGI